MPSETAEIGRTAVLESPQKVSRHIARTHSGNGRLARPGGPGSTPLEPRESQSAGRSRAGETRPEEASATDAVSHLIEDLVVLAHRRKCLGSFCSTKHRKALRFVRAIVRCEQQAEDVLAAGYAKLAAGRTPPEHFFRALKQLGRDSLRRSQFEARIFESLDAWVSSRRPRHEEEGESPGELRSLDSVASHQGENRDPLDVLLDGEEREEHKRLVKLAKRHPKWRYAKRREWAKPLVKCVRN